MLVPAGRVRDARCRSGSARSARRAPGRSAPRSGAPGRRISRCESCWASTGSNSELTERASSARSTGSGRSSSEPASRRERSSRSTDSFASRSTCWRTCARKRRRVSSSSSSSSSSSTKPPSEKSGVRSSCEAVAMNCLRARSSCASWRCMSLKATRELAELVVGVDRDRAREVAGGDLLGRLLQALDALRERARDQPAGEHRERERDRAGDEDLRADDRDVALDVGHRRRVDGDLGDAAVAGAAAPRPRRRARRRTPPSRSRCGRVRAAVVGRRQRERGQRRVARVGDRAGHAARRRRGRSAAA